MDKEDDTGFPPPLNVCGGDVLRRNDGRKWGAVRGYLTNWLPDAQLDAQETRILPAGGPLHYSNALHMVTIVNYLSIWERSALRAGTRLFVGIGAVALAACGDSAGPSDFTPTPTTPGTPTGAPISQSIGAAGGNLSSADGSLTVVVPAGAVAGATAFSITPITYPAGGSGAAYRLEPSGVTFTQPVTVTFHYVASDVGELDEQGQGIAYQGADGVWRAMLESSVNDLNNTVSVTTTHFTDFIRVTFWKFVPSSAVLDVNQTLALFVEACIREDPGPNEPVTLGFDELSRLPRCYPSIRTGVWSVNNVQGGNGTVGRVAVGASTASAVYTAPASAPSPRTVSVTADMTWAARGVTKRFTSRVTIGGTELHVIGEFAKTGVPIGALVISDVTDRVEFDVSLQGGGSVTINNFQNFTSLREADRLAPNYVGILCNFSVSGTFEFGTYTSFATSYNVQQEVVLYFGGMGSWATNNGFALSNGMCSQFSTVPGVPTNASGSYLEYDPTFFTAVGMELIVYGEDITGTANGWVFTLRRTQ